MRCALASLAAWLACAAPVLLPATVCAADFRSIAEPAVLYDAPSAHAAKLFVASPLYPVEVVVNIDNWAKVRDATGGLAWVEKKSLSERRTVLVKAAVADVRQAPDEGAPLAFQVRENVALDLTEVGTTGWVKVRHRDGQTGYIRASQVWGL
jgi:SH3-like domain-containing protein